MFVTLALPIVGVANAEDPPCVGLLCHGTTTTVTGADDEASLTGVQDIVVAGGHRATTRHRASTGCTGCEWDFVPACLHGSPTDGANDVYCEVAATACRPDGGILMRIYFRPDSAAGWQAVGQDCIGGNRRAVPVRDITAAVARHLDTLTVPAPTLAVDPPGRAVTGVPVIVAADPQPTFRETFFAAGVPVDITLNPADWTWTFDTVAPFTTTTPGHRYDGHSALDRAYYVQHTYGDAGAHRVTVTVRWTGSYVIRGLPDVDSVPDRTTTATAGFTVRDAHAVLVGG
jgi:hypothetical protein